MKSGCLFCTDPQKRWMCESCSRSYDRRSNDAGDVHSVMAWASDRTRRALRHLLVTPRKLSTLIAFIKAADELSTFVDTEQWGDGEAALSRKRFLRARSAVCKSWGTR